MRRQAIGAAAWILAAAICASAQQFQFMDFATRPPQSFLPTPAAVLGGYALGNLDGDPLLDYLVVEGGTGRALFARPDGGFVAMPLPGGLAGQAPWLTDIDGDGDLDVVLTSPHASRSMPLQVLRRTPTAYQFVTLPNVVIGSVQGAAIGDLDGDGDVDLVVGTLGAGNPPLVVLRNSGAGTFTHDVPAIPTGLTSELWPRLCDFDVDGDLDILASTATGPFVLLRNQGPSFVSAAGSLPAARAGHTFLGTADLDGDGFVDAAAVWSNGALDVLWGTGTGFTFQAAVLPAVNARGLVPADVDGDGDLDLVADRSTGVDILRNTGPRQFTRESAIAEAVGSLGVFDVGPDGAADLVFTTAAAPSFVRCWQRGAPGSEDAGSRLGIRVPPTVMRSHMPLCADVDGDQRADLLIPSNAGMIVDRSRGDTGYVMSLVDQLRASASTIERSAFADLDGDADQDLVVVTDAVLSWWRNVGGGAFGAAASYLSSGPGPGLDDLRLGDVDADGDVDILLAMPYGVELWRNQGGGSLAPATLLASTVTTTALDLVDLDGDGNPELIANTPANFGGGFRVLTNDRTGNFGVSGAPVAFGASPRAIAHADVDADGDQDLVAVALGLEWHRNDGTGVLTRAPQGHMPPVTSLPISNLVLADLDSDGDVDVFAVASPGNTGVLAFNDGTGRFVNLASSRLPQFATGLAARASAVDIDEDGDLDLLVGIAPSPQFSIERQHVFVNHLRQLRSLVAPLLGQNAQFHVYSGPGFGSPGVAMLGLSFGLLPLPVSVPGFAGKLQIDPASAQIAATVVTSTVGVSTAFVPVPNSQALVGLPVWLQAAVLPIAGQPGLTNAVYEVVLR